MDNLVRIVQTGKAKNVVKVTPLIPESDIALVPVLQRVFEKLLERKKFFVILDLERLSGLPSSLVVLLLEMTAKFRRKGGNLVMLNLQPSAKADLDRFHPLNFLKKSEHISKALDLFNDHSPVKTTKPERSDIKMVNRSVRIASRVNHLYRACDFVTDIAGRLRLTQSEINKIKIAVYEACLNVIEHAYHSDTNRSIDVNVEVKPDRLIIRITDFGEGFQVDDTKSFDIENAVSGRERGGMGLHIIKRAVDDLSYTQDTLEGNQLIMTKYLKEET